MRRQANAVRGVLVVCAVFAVSARGGAARAAGAPAALTGSRVCRKCHEPFYEKWVSSWHGKAMQPYGGAYAASTLAPMLTPIPAGDGAYRVDVNAGAVVCEGGGGMRKYSIAHVMGGKNTAYFLTPFTRGRLQVLPLAFDTRRREWYDTTGSMVRHFRGDPDAAIPWTDPSLTFNTSCYGCHVSQLRKNYDPATDTYRTEWAEPGINCETCHGPGEAHVAAMEALPPGATPGDLRIVSTKRMTPAQVNSLCGACHGKAAPFTQGFAPGDDFFDHYVLACLEDRDFHPDGRDLGENFTQTGWLQSPCTKAADFTCTHCHTSSGRNRHAGARADEACLPCHERHVKEPAAHSHHKAESAGSRCVACHMPETEFARMRRHDHSMRPPAPAASTAFGSPNACTLCHADKTPAWADGLVREWYPGDYQAPILAAGALVAAARAGDWKRLDEMLAYLANPARNQVVAASLLRLLPACDDARKWPALFAAVRDPSPLVRGSVARNLSVAPPEPLRALEALCELGKDARRAVRFEAGAELARVPRQSVPEQSRPAVAEIANAYEGLLRERIDDYASHYNLGNLAQDRGELDKALARYQTARTLNPSFVPAYVNASMCYARRGDVDAAERVLRDALRVEPRSAEALFNLGLLRAERGDSAEAEQCLRAALKANARLAQAAYNLGVLLIAERPAEGFAMLRKAVEDAPGEPRYAYALAFHLRRVGERNDAISVLVNLRARHPAFADAFALLGLLYEEVGEVRPALELYKEAVAREDLPPELREECAARMAAFEKR